MNLGLRDAIGLGPVLMAHLKASQTFPLPHNLDKPIREYAISRQRRALEVINMTKGIISLTTFLRPDAYWRIWLLKYFGNFRVVKNAAAWRLSGLGAR